jgi:hypothetical protein
MNMHAVILAGLLLGTAPTAPDATELMITQAVSIADALAHDRLDNVSTNAASITLEATSLGKPAAKVASAASDLQKATKIADVRSAFGKFSEALVSYLDAQKREPGNGIKVAVCPMLQKPWLQKEGPIQNPYYGSQMLTCGNFKK